MRRSPADSTNRSLAAFGKLQHIQFVQCWNCGANGPEGRTPESRLLADIDQRSQGRRGASVWRGACPGSAASGRPVAMCAAIAGWPVRWAWTRSPTHKRAVVRPPPPPDPQGRALTRCRVERVEGARRGSDAGASSPGGRATTAPYLTGAKRTESQEI